MFSDAVGHLQGPTAFLFSQGTAFVVENKCTEMNTFANERSSSQNFVG
jgi:hypothetical protein